MSTNLVGLITLGGTITTTRESAPYPSVDGKTLLKRAGLPEDQAVIEDLRLLRGSRLEVTDANAVIHLVQRLVADKTITGVVITTGTATLEELAFLLAVTVPATKPVVVTGAARLFDDDSWDGASNLRDAFVVAEHTTSLNGITIAFGETLHSPLLARKTVHNRTLTIESPPLGPMGLVCRGSVAMRYPPIELRHLGSKSSIGRQVLIWPVGLGDSGTLLGLLKNAIDAIILVGFPGLELGLPEPIMALAREFLDREMLVAYASRCEEVCSTAVLREEPRLLVSEYLTPTKLRLLIMAAPERTDLRAELQGALKQVDEGIRSTWKELTPHKNKG